MSNNILPDDEFMPRLADFGLAKPLLRQSLDEEESVMTMSQVVGSCGYLVLGTFATFCTMTFHESGNIYSNLSPPIFNNLNNQNSAYFCSSYVLLYA